MTTMEKRLLPFVGQVLAESNLEFNTFRTSDLNDFDGRRIYIALDDEEDFSYFIRTWNMTERGIDFTLFVNTENNANKMPDEILQGFYSRIFVR